MTDYYLELDIGAQMSPFPLDYYLSPLMAFQSLENLPALTGAMNCVAGGYAAEEGNEGDSMGEEVACVHVDDEEDTCTVVDYPLGRLSEDVDLDPVVVDKGILPHSVSEGSPDA